eukprot:TRINITY_DN686_c0_g1_i1.p1 TRINITY_DN686_c0_g1~~TRINITY_DN686_c0_g1_i1.p1  ORF type:complete len:1209 (+),score=259.06 TRINITY_DN686_c0_g1_i1:95-3721(+)
MQNQDTQLLSPREEEAGVEEGASKSSENETSATAEDVAVGPVCQQMEKSDFTVQERRTSVCLAPSQNNDAKPNLNQINNNGWNFSIIESSSSTSFSNTQESKNEEELQRQRIALHRLLLGTEGQEIKDEDDLRRQIAHRQRLDRRAAVGHLRIPQNQSLQRSVSADLSAMTRMKIRRDSRHFTRRQSHYEFDPRKLVEAKRQAGFWRDGSWKSLDSLKFRDADDEKAFCKLYREKGRKILRLWCAVFFMLSCAMIMWRPAELSLFHRILWISLSVLQLSINFFYLVVINSVLWSQMRIQLITMGILSINAVLMAFYASVLHKFPDSAISLILIGYGSIRLRLSYSLIVGLITSVSCNVLFVLFTQESFLSLVFMNIHLLATNAIGAVTGYFLERKERVHFVDLYTYYEDCSLVEFEKHKIDFLLKAAIPAKFIEQLPSSNPAEKFSSVSVAFICLDNVIEYTDTRNSEDSVKILNELFRVCEARTQQSGCEKIKTIQDKFMVLCGAPAPQADHALVLADMILAVVQDFKEIQETDEFKRKYPGLRLCVRVGMSSGPIVAGVIGVKRFCWDIWGDTVNVASRMEDPKNGNKHRPAEIRISCATEKLLRETHICTPASKINVKGKGEMDTFVLEGRKKSRLSQRRPSEPRENQLPEYRAFSWESVQEESPAPNPNSCVDATFKLRHFQKNLHSTRTVMGFVIAVYSLCGFMYFCLPFDVPPIVYILRYAFVLPVWIAHISATHASWYSMEWSAFLNCASLLAMIGCTVLSQLLINRKMFALQSSGVMESSLSQLNWISFLSYVFFGISFLHNYVLFTLLLGVAGGAAVWIFSGVFASIHEFPWVLSHFLVFTLLASFWVSYELNSMTVKTWQLACGIDERKRELDHKKKVVDQILTNIIPSPYLSYVSSQHELNIDIRGMHKSHPNVCVLSSDVCNFTMITEKMDPITLVSSLHELFTRFDALTGKYGLEKVKTVGDAYVACSGLFAENGLKSQTGYDLKSVVEAAVGMALDMQEEVAAYNQAHPDRTSIAIRVGVHCGHVFSGIVGHSKFQFDVFGNTVSVTDSLERGGRIWAVHVSEEVKQQLDSLFLSRWAGDLVVHEWEGYQYRNLSGKSYLLQRKRWIDEAGEVRVFKSDCSWPTEVKSTLSVLTQFVEFKCRPQRKRRSSSSFRSAAAAAATLKAAKSAAMTSRSGSKPIERKLGKSSSDGRIK